MSTISTIFTFQVSRVSTITCDQLNLRILLSALNMSADVAGATFMAAATSAPELFVNVIGTFITEGDIGVGTIVGSAVFNILAVAACCGIGAGMVRLIQFICSFFYVLYLMGFYAGSLKIGACVFVFSDGNPFT